MSAFCGSCGHALALHHHPTISPGRACSLDCGCRRFKEEGPTSEEQRAEIRRLSELVRTKLEVDHG